MENLKDLAKVKTEDDRPIYTVVFRTEDRVYTLEGVMSITIEQVIPLNEGFLSREPGDEK